MKKFFETGTGKAAFAAAFRSMFAESTLNLMFYTGLYANKF